MILIDAGPLVAILDRSDTQHERCVRVLASVEVPLLTTLPAFSEAMHLLGDDGGWRAQELLWGLLFRGDLRLADLDEALLKRAFELMSKYHDLPMDLADATLVAVAEDRNLDRIFTLDKDFHIYRLHGRKSFETVP